LSVLHRVTSVHEALGWLNEAGRGARVTYHVGNLAIDRGLTLADGIANTFWHAYKVGDVDLVQTRIGPAGDGICAYVAIRRGERW